MTKHYAINKHSNIDPTEVGELEYNLKRICNKISSISVIHYAQPQVVLLHCEGDGLTNEELETITNSIDNPLHNS